MKKFLTAILLISGLFSVVSAFASNPCLSLSTSTTDPNKYYAFQGNNGTLSQLDGLAIWVGPDQNNPSVLNGSISYYQDAFGSGLTGSCIDNKNDTATVSLSGNIGSVNGTFYVTPAGPIFHVTSTSLLNHDGQYSNVSGDLILSVYPWSK